MTSQRQTAVELLAAALRIDPKGLDPASAPGETPGWDSLAHMRLVAALEAILARPLEPLEVFSIGGVEDVERLLPPGALP